MCNQEQHLRSNNHKFWLPIIFYLIAIIFGIISGATDSEFLHKSALIISDITIKLFKLISLPLISLSLIVTITGYESGNSMKKLGKRVITYTISTTIMAAFVALILFIAINPEAPNLIDLHQDTTLVTDQTGGYYEHVAKIIPSSIFQPFLEHNVFGVLMISILLGIAVRNIPTMEQANVLKNMFRGLHAIFIFFTKYMIKLIPIALYGFVTIMMKDFKMGLNLSGVGSYLVVIVAANLIQGIVVLPLLLIKNKISTYNTFKGALPALSLAFFSKSSAATLPVTIQCAEQRLGIKHKVANFVLPLCTTINMNGCAAFILATILFVLKSHGVELNLLMMLGWLAIAVIAAIGNAGVPMGCFFLSASLLSTMGMDLALLGIILPFYSIIDMIETSLNVWSDICVTKIVDQEA
jgi:Na+/H+-dicarboxylate symporter